MTTLLIIDPQVDFHSSGSLSVNGADEDSERISSLILNNFQKIDQIIVTLDSHHKYHIAHTLFWKSRDDLPPVPFQNISFKDIEDGVWLPRDSSLLVTLLFSRILVIN